MKTKVIYHTKSRKCRIQDVQLISLGRGCYYLHANFNVRGMEIHYWGSSTAAGSSLRKSYSVFFGDGKDMLFELKLLPETRKDGDINWLGQVSKDYFEAYIVPWSLMNYHFRRLDRVSKR